MEHNMQDIIQNSSHLSEYDKDIFCSVFKKLEKKQNVLFQSIAKNVENQMFQIKDKNIYTIW